jgi:hypothetical protein
MKNGFPNTPPKILKLSTVTGSVFLVLTSCNPVKVSGRFGGTYHLLLQRRKVSAERSQHETGSVQLSV